MGSHWSSNPGPAAGFHTRYFPGCGWEGDGSVDACMCASVHSLGFCRILNIFKDMKCQIQL